MQSKHAELAKGFTLPSQPKRTEVDDATARRFIAGDAAKTTRGSRLRREESGERVAVYLPPELVTALRVRCAQERRSVSDAITEAVSAWVGPKST